MTNLEYIRSMDIEAMADLLEGLHQCPPSEVDRCWEDGLTCNDCWKKWLEEERRTNGKE